MACIASVAGGRAASCAIAGAELDPIRERGQVRKRRERVGAVRLRAPHRVIVRGSPRRGRRQPGPRDQQPGRDSDEGRASSAQRSESRPKAPMVTTPAGDRRCAPLALAPWRTLTIMMPTMSIPMCQTHRRPREGAAVVARAKGRDRAGHGRRTDRSLASIVHTGAAVVAPPRGSTKSSGRVSSATPARQSNQREPKHGRTAPGWSRSQTPARSTISSSVPSVRATRGHCSGHRRSGTRRRQYRVTAPSSTRAAC